MVSKHEKNTKLNLSQVWRVKNLGFDFKKSKVLINRKKRENNGKYEKSDVNRWAADKLLGGHPKLVYFVHNKTVVDFFVNTWTLQVVWIQTNVAGNICRTKLNQGFAHKHDFIKNYVPNQNELNRAFFWNKSWSFILVNNK